MIKSKINNLQEMYLNNIKSKGEFSKMNKVKVSIIVPVYNVEAYIARCLDSLVNQTLKEIEIIIVNDNTPDNSIKICEEYASRDNRIRIFSKENEGLGLTRNYGMKHANGEFIAFVDSDDFIDKDFYEKLYKGAQMKQADVCFAEYKAYKCNQEKEKIKGKIPFVNDTENTEDVLYSMLNFKKYGCEKCYMGMSVWRAIYKRKIIQENNILFVSERKYISEDIIFNFDFLENSQKASFVKDTYYHYCYNNTSLTHVYRKDRFEKAKVLKEKLIEKAIEYNELDNLDEGIIRFFMGYVRTAIKQEACNTISLKIRKQNIKKIINDEEVKKALKNKQSENLKRNIFDFLMKTNQITILIIFCNIINKIKR